MHRRPAIALLVVALLLVTARAGADGQRDEARAHHELAKVQFAQGKFAAAEREFKAAYALAPIPDLLFNIGVCQEKQRKNAAAVKSYERYLATGPAEADRVEVEARVARLRRELAPEKASAPVDEEVAAPAPATPLYKKWWLWTVVGVVVAGAAVGVGVGVAPTSNSGPRLDFPAVSFP